MSRAIEGLAAGVILAIMLAVLVKVVVRRETLMGRYHISYWELVRAYLIGGAAGGALWGVLRPMCRTLVRSVIAGYFIMLPFALEVTLVFGKRWLENPTLTNYLILAFAQPVTGAIGGAIAWSYYVK